VTQQTSIEGIPGIISVCITMSH